jgi:hypothetical protein
MLKKRRSPNLSLSSPSLAQPRHRNGHGALDHSSELNDPSLVQIPGIKILGELHKTPWQRFARLQRTAAKLAKGRGQPKGVFRFASNEECTAWTANLSRSGK